MSNAQIFNGSPLSPALATDPELCRVSGYLKDMSGYPLKGVGITIRNACYDPIGLVADTLVMGERLVYRTNKDGYVQFDLLRGSKLDVELPNRLLDHILHCVVPDAASVDLLDFFFPHVLSVEFLSDDPTLASVGDHITLELQATLSNGVLVVLDGVSTVLSSSDEALVLKENSFTFEALSVGSVTISVDSFDQTKLDILKQPDGTAISLQNLPTPTLPADLTITVS